MANETDYLEGWNAPEDTTQETDYLEGWEPPKKQGIKLKDRGFFSDILHSAYQGLGDAAKLTGQGIEQFTGIDTGLESVGKSIEQSDFARPDYNEAMGTDGRVKGILQQAARSLPNMIPAAAGAGLVAVTGGGALLAGGAAALASFVPMAGGTYAQMKDRLDVEQPGMSEEEKHNVAFREAAYEWVPEAIGNIATLGAGSAVAGLGKNFFKGGAKFLVENGSMTVDDIVKSALKGKSVKQVTAAMFGGAGVEGGTELATAFLQEANQADAGLDVQKANKVDLFFASMIPGTAFSSIGYATGLNTARKIKDNVEKGLGSDDLGQRMHTVNSVADQIATTDEEFANSFRNIMSKKVESGPVSLETMINEDTKVDTLYTDITEKADTIVADAGIPLGTAEENDRAALEATPEVYEETRVLDEVTDFEEPMPVISEEVSNYMSIIKAETPEVGTVEYDQHIAENDRLTAALKLDDNRSKAIRSGMERILQDTNKLAEITDLDEREVLQSRIEKTQKQISKEASGILPRDIPNAVKTVATKPVVAEEDKAIIAELESKGLKASPARIAQRKIAKDMNTSIDGMSKELGRKPVVAPVKPVVKEAVPVVKSEVKPVVVPKNVSEVKAPIASKTITPVVSPKVAEVKLDNYKDQLTAVEGLDDRLQRLQATKGTPDVVAQAKQDAKKLAPMVQAARKHLQTLPKPVAEPTVFKNKEAKKIAKAIEEPKYLSKEVASVALAIQDLGISMTPEHQLILSRQKGLSKKNLNTPKKVKAAAETFKKSLETPQKISDKGVGNGRVVSYHEGTTVEYKGNIDPKKRWLVRQGSVVKRVASLPEAHKAITEGTVSKLEDYEDKGKTSKSLKDMPKLSREQKAAVEMFLANQDPKEFGNPSDVMMAAASLASQDKLYVDGALQKGELETETKSWKNAEEGSSEQNLASKVGVKSGYTQGGELSTDEDIVQPKIATEKEKAAQKEANQTAAQERKAKLDAEVKTIEATDDLKAMYLARHLAAQAKIKADGLSKEDYIGKKAGNTLEKEAKDILDAPESIFGNDQALREEEVMLSWKKNVHPTLSKEVVGKIYDEWIRPYDNNPVLGLLAFNKMYDGPVVGELLDTKMQLRYDGLNNKTATVAWFEDRFKTALDLLDGVIEYGTKEEVILAKFIKSSKKIDKLKSIDVFADTASYFSDKRGGEIGMSPAAMLRTGTWLHELQHAVTSQEIISNEKLRKEVEIMVRNLKNSSGLSASQIALVESAKGDATVFNNIPGKFDLFTADELQVAYALVNEREFLAQAYGSDVVRAKLKNIRHTGDIVKKSVWKRIKEVFTEILGLNKDYDSLLEAVLRVSVRLYNTSITGVEATRDMALENRRTETLDEATRKVLEEKKHINKYKEKAYEKGSQALSTFKKLAEPISDTLMRISKPLYSKLMTMEAFQVLKGTEYRNGITPFLKYYKNLTESQKIRLDIGLANSNEVVWNEMPKDVRVSLEAVLSDGADRQINVGLLVEKKPFYFPRRVKDIQKLSDYLMKDLDVKGPLGMALNAKAQELGMEIAELPQAIRNQVVTDMLASGEIMQLPKPGSSKKRTIGKLTSDLYPFYENSSSALLAHIYELNDKVSLREFVGGSARKTKIRNLMSLNKQIDKEEDATKKAALMGQWKLKAAELQNLELDLDEGIQSLIDKELSHESAAVQTEVLSLLSARMRQKGASGIVDTARNIGYIATMGNFLSAITQFGDIPIVFYRYGINKDTLSSVGEAFKAVGSIAKGEITGKSVVNDAFVGDLDFTNALREFTSGENMSGKALDMIFKYSGLKYADLIGKESSMRASFKFYQNPKNKQKFLEKFKDFFEKPEEVLQKIQVGNRKDVDVMTAIFAELSDFQPVSLSQQSEVYLKAGNMRMFYALKTFTLRTTSAAIREGMNDFKLGGKKNIAKGTARIASIIMVYALAGAGADEIKDLLRGKESSITDNTVDNILQMFFLSKYTMVQGMQKDQVIQGFINNLIPPVRYADNFIADVSALFIEDKEFKFKSLSIFPIIGAFVQARTGAQQATYASQDKKAILEDVKANGKSRKGARDGSITDRVRAYNKKVPVSERINDEAIMRAYKSGK